MRHVWGGGPGVSLLSLTPAEAGGYAGARPGWWFVPCRVEADGRGGFVKRPLAMWTSEAASGASDVEALWQRTCDRLGAERLGIAVVTGPSGLVVLDEDHDTYPDDMKSWLAAVGTLTLRSCTKARPHWFFRQEHGPDGQALVGEGRWVGGDVKATGLVFLSDSEPVVVQELAGVSALLAEGSPFHGALPGPGGGAGAAGTCSREELRRWLDSVPGDDLLVESLEAQDKFIQRVVDKMRSKVHDGGAHRRTACAEAVYHACIEASAGLYSADRAFGALEDEYLSLRSQDGSWGSDRRRDWYLMWQTLIPKIENGSLEDAVTECRQGAIDRGAVHVPDDPGLDYLMWLSEGWVAEDAADAGVADSGGASAPDRTDTTPADVLRRRLAEVKAAVDVADEVVGVSEAVLAESAAPEPERAWATSEVPVEPAVSVPAGRPEPVLGIDAMWGPHWALIESLRGLHEVADVGLLAGLLAEAGSFLSGAAHWSVAGVDVHGPQLFVNMVGASGVARKTHAMNIAQAVFTDDAIFGVSGLGSGGGVRREKCKGSGEFVVHRVWAETEMVTASGLTVPEPASRRVLFRMPEVSVLWAKSRSDGSVLAETFCEMWDQSPLEAGSLTSGSAKVARDAYLVGSFGASVVELARAAVLGRGSTDAYSGFGNRFLWFWLPESGVDLPLGEVDISMHPAVLEYRERYRWRGADAGAGGGFGARASWSTEARELWISEYGLLKRSKGSAGASGAVRGLLGRAEPYVLRLALGLSLAADGASGVVVSAGALRAALAVWRYCVESVEYVFGDVADVADLSDSGLVRVTLAEAGGLMSRADLKEEMRWAGSRLTAVVRAMAASGEVRIWKVKTPSGGPPKQYIALPDIDVAGHVPGAVEG